MGPRKSLRYRDNFALSINPVSPPHFFLECGISVIVATKRKFGLVFSSFSRTAKNGASSGRRLGERRDKCLSPQSGSAFVAMVKKGVSADKHKDQPEKCARETVLYVCPT